MRDAFAVRLTSEAKSDLQELYGFLLALDVSTAERALAAIEDGFNFLSRSPFSCRKAAQGAHGPLLRELIIAFGASGYVALFEIDNANSVTVLAIRHQRESDYH